MKVLITGGAGFIGSHMARFHLDRSDEVYVIDNLLSGKIENIASCINNPNFHFIQADILDYPDLSQLIAKMDYIYHMSAMVGMKLVLSRPIDVLHVNIKTCERILEEAALADRGIRVVITSSSCVYQTQELAKETDPLVSIPAGQYDQHIYALSKMVNEAMGLAYHSRRGLYCAIARPFNVIGTHQTSRYGMVVPSFVKQALRHEPITVYGDGLQARSFCDVRDAVLAMSSMMETDACNGEIANVGCAKDISIFALAQLIRKKTNSRSPIIFVPYEEAYGQKFYDIKKRVPVVEKLADLIGFRAEFSLDETLDEIIRFEKGHL